MTVKQVMERLGVCRKTVYNMVNNLYYDSATRTPREKNYNFPRPLKFGGRNMKFKKVEVDKWIESTQS